MIIETLEQEKLGYIKQEDFLLKEQEIQNEKQKKLSIMKLELESRLSKQLEETKEEQKQT